MALTRADQKERLPFGTVLRKHAPFLFHISSLFYFALGVIFVGFAWMAWSIFTNSFTHMFGWDYSLQFVPFAYQYYDAWHLFLKTGQFPLYATSTFLGSDNIASNSYYGLFDPFVVAMIFFPRSWIPQLFAVMTVAKITCGVFFMRAYLRYMKVSEWSSRLGAVIYGFSGYMCFMVGFPSTVSVCVYVPLILLGIERIVQEQKPYALIIGLFLEGITSFFFLITLCIFGVIYALWRYFWSIKERKKEQNIKVMAMGVASFAVGILLCSWTLVPSLRESMLSGRSSSIGSAYLRAIIHSLKEHDLRSFFGFIFEEVGDNPGRELMALVSFFFPSGGYLELPMVSANQSYVYDAWTASIFCYTPCVILFFSALIHSIAQKKINHLIAVLLCLFLLFTNSSYFFFYAFSGNGYGRWFIVLVPSLIYYCCWALDQRQTGYKWIPLASSILALLGTVIAYWLIFLLLEGKSFTNVNGLTYWKHSYLLPDAEGKGTFFERHRNWYFYYQIAIVAIEAGLYVGFTKKKWLPHALLAAAVTEIIITGNVSASYVSSWSYERSFLGGRQNLETSQIIANRINEDDSFFRSYFDNAYGNKNFQNAIGVNASGAFHSLMNFDVEDFAFMNHMKTHGDTVGPTYGGETLYNPHWSGYYGHKRYGVDFALGYRYHVVKNDYSAWNQWVGVNVPFGAEEIKDDSIDSNQFRIFRVHENFMPSLGHAVDSSRLYKMGHIEDSEYLTSWYSNAWNSRGNYEVYRNSREEVEGAIFDDGVELPDGLSYNEIIPEASVSGLTNTYGKTPITMSSSKGFKVVVYRTTGSDKLMPSSSSSYKNEGVGYYINHHDSTYNIVSSKTVMRDYDHISLIPKTGTYWNEDIKGAYLEFSYFNSSVQPRIVLIGDTFDEGGNLLKENQVLGFEYRAFTNAKSGEYYNGYAQSFGLYAHGGRVKEIMICFPGNGSLTFDPTGVSFLLHEYSEIAGMAEKYAVDLGLKNVVKGVNNYRFDTKFHHEVDEKGKIIVTQLGYDAGWKAYGVDNNGKKHQVPSYRLDGGLYGLYAPKEYESYLLVYQTPYSNLSGALTLIGILSCGGYGLYLYLHKKKEKAVA